MKTVASPPPAPPAIRTGTSLRTRLVLAITLTALPLLALIWSDAHRQFERESAALEQEVERLTAFITGDVNHLLDATRQILVAVASISRTARPEDARIILAELAGQCPHYASLGVVPSRAGRDGPDPVLTAARESLDDGTVQRAAASRRLTIGKFRTVQGGKDLLSVAYGVPGPTPGSPPTVCFAVLDLKWLDLLLAEERVTGSKSLFPAGMVLNVLDRSGTILTRHPDRGAWAGKPFPDSRVLQEIIRKGEGTADLVGVSGVKRLYAFKSVAAVSGDILVSIGVSREVALAAARRDMHRSLLGVGVVGLLLVLGAWFGTSWFIARPVASLVGATRQLTAGNLAVRTALPRGPAEIHHLAHAFNGLAESLEQASTAREAMQSRLVAYDRQLRSMSVQAALAEEQERQRIAVALHDKAGPLLATGYMKLGRALKHPAPDKVTAALSESRDLIDKAIGELRSLTFDLSSPTLHTLGLAPAIEELCRDMARHHPLAIACEDRGMPRDLNPDLGIVLYRAARELLLNAIKHAEASHATVVCGGDAETAFIEVSDDGAGFDAADAGLGFSRTGGFGLFNLRERLAHLGGRLTVESSRGAGTRAIVTLPILRDAPPKEDSHADSSLPG